MPCPQLEAFCTVVLGVFFLLRKAPISLLPVPLATLLGVCGTRCRLHHPEPPAMLLSFTRRAFFILKVYLLGKLLEHIATLLLRFLGLA